MVDEKVLEQRVNYRSSKTDSHQMQCLVCWRQHPAIHYWMQKLQNARYSEGVNKNKLKVYVHLCEYDILALKHAIVRGNLDFGKHGKMIGKSNQNDKEQEELDLKFISLALEALQKGYELVYKSYIVDKNDTINCETFLNKKAKKHVTNKQSSKRSRSLKLSTKPTKVGSFTPKKTTKQTSRVKKLTRKFSSVQLPSKKSSKRIRKTYKRSKRRSKKSTKSKRPNPFGSSTSYTKYSDGYPSSDDISGVFRLSS